MNFFVIVEVFVNPIWIVERAGIADLNAGESSKAIAIIHPAVGCVKFSFNFFHFICIITMYSTLYL